MRWSNRWSQLCLLTCVVRLLVSGSDDYQLLLWDVHNRKKIRSYPTSHTGNIFSVKVCVIFLYWRYSTFWEVTHLINNLFVFSVNIGYLPKYKCEIASTSVQYVTVRSDMSMVAPSLASPVRTAHWAPIFQKALKMFCPRLLVVVGEEVFVDEGLV